jgi:hypothetical protein
VSPASAALSGCSPDTGGLSSAESVVATHSALAVSLFVNPDYVVDKVEIVTPDDVSVLRPIAGASMTLVTCYPFYFAGGAPQRYIVHASITAAQ